MPKLNKAQQEAIEYLGGPLIIVAGAGTGKTTVIANKIAYLIKEKKVLPEQILALTFTDKASEEMTDRVDQMIDIGYAELQISTFHSFCQKLLEWHGFDIGLSRDFKMLPESDAWILCRKYLDKFNLNYYRPLGNPAGKIKNLLSHFSKCKDELITPEQYLEHAQNVKLDTDEINKDEKSRLEEVANAYHVYNQILLDNNALDFSDLIFYAIKLITERPKILQSLQKKYKYILVDEFQDVNWAQYFLTRLITGKNAQLTVVGDDDQSIYAFRGASVSNILRFKDDYPQAKEIVLNENYRSGQNILDCAYKLIQNNNPDRLEIKMSLNKKLKSNKKTASEVTCLPCADINEEAQTVVDKILEIKKTDADAAWNDFAILIRANSHSEPFMAALEKAGVPYEFLAAAGLYRQPIVLDCFNFFKLLDNYHESSAVYRLLCLPCFNISTEDLRKISAYEHKFKKSFYEILKTPSLAGLSEDGVKIATKFVSLIEAGEISARQENPTAVLYKFLEKSGYLSYLTTQEEAGNTDIFRQNKHLLSFFEYIKKYEEINAGARVRDFLEHFTYVLESGDAGALKQQSDTPESVNIITIHKAKGLEYKYVFAVNLVEERFPARRRGEPVEIPLALIKEKLPEGDSHIQEERRLFYVAITRAKEKLFLLSADDYGGVRAKKPSRFLSECGFAVKTNKTIVKNKKTGLINYDAKKSSDEKIIYQTPESFSFTQISDYDKCPYRYKLKAILRVPAKGSAYTSFGKTMHSVMQKFYQRVQELNRVEQASIFSAPVANKITTPTAPSLDELLHIYEVSWIDEWYESKIQKEEYYNLGKKILRDFYKTNENKWTVPVLLEEPFKIKIGDYILNGRVDRADILADGALEIIDYKTGESKDDLKSEDKNQLMIYQIAAEQLPEYKIYGAPSKLTYLYLKDGVELSFLGAEKEKDKLKQNIADTIDQILSQDFTPAPSSHECAWCDYKDICQFRV